MTEVSGDTQIRIHSASTDLSPHMLPSVGTPQSDTKITNIVNQSLQEILNKRAGLLETGPVIGCLRTFNCNPEVLNRSLSSVFKFADGVIVCINSVAEKPSGHTMQVISSFVANNPNIRIIHDTQEFGNLQDGEKFILVNDIGTTIKPDYLEHVGGDTWCRGIFPLQLMIQQAQEISTFRQVSENEKTLPGKILFFSTEVAISETEFNALSSELSVPMAVVAGLPFEHHYFGERSQEPDGTYRCSALRQPRNTAALWLINDLDATKMGIYIAKMMSLEKVVKNHLANPNSQEQDLVEAVFRVLSTNLREKPSSDLELKPVAYRAAQTFVDIFKARGGMNLKPEDVKLLGMEEIYMAHCAAARIRSELLATVKENVMQGGYRIDKELMRLALYETRKSFQPTMRLANTEPNKYNKAGWNEERHRLHDAKFDTTHNRGKIVQRGFESFMHLAATCFTPTQSVAINDSGNNKVFLRGDVKVKAPTRK